MRPPEEVVGRRVRLTRWSSADADELQRVVEEAQEYLKPWLFWAYGEYRAADFLHLSDEQWEAGKAYPYALRTEGRIVGAVGLERRIGPGGIEIGYWLHPSWAGRGLMTEAVAALLPVAFALPDVDRIQIWHDAANEASAGVPRRLGFTEVARHHPPREEPRPGMAGTDVVWELGEFAHPIAESD
ncbi:GNAT family N-acetyltransferase [Amycolatopsis sp. YIM 10]|uniref:GNAT family N-acetyltransferase n=1 Tax=Amycolatopsis sp. YIM 10 TaxID=2653857 RepID=UPI0012903C10|nr:GNAT family N-acetyltransferase [Amycolatopsis sp. YIM 10]QFU86200.1 Putative ribosomal N-acetyltransferase YdaF [Amycolatopsis sp. YIM 10]